MGEADPVTGLIKQLGKKERMAAIGKSCTHEHLTIAKKTGKIRAHSNCRELSNLWKGKETSNETSRAAIGQVVSKRPE